MRIAKICQLENIEFNKETLLYLIKENLPDLRAILNIIQREKANGIVDIVRIKNALTSFSNDGVEELLKCFKEKDFEGLKQWAADNSENCVWEDLYAGFEKTLKPSEFALAILTLAKYQYQEAFVMDKKINLLACLFELSKIVK